MAMVVSNIHVCKDICTCVIQSGVNEILFRKIQETGHTNKEITRSV